MLSPKERQRLDDLLGRELGRNPFGEPMYKWQFSEDMVHHMVIAGKYNMVETPAGIIVPEPVTQCRKMYPMYDRQWFMTRWWWAPEENWRREYGSALEWPRRGFYLLVDNSNLADGVDPDLTSTEDFIRTMKAQLAKTRADWDAEFERADAKLEKLMDERIDTILDGSCAVFALNPGSGASDVHLPTKKFTENYDSAFQPK